MEIINLIIIFAAISMIAYGFLQVMYMIRKSKMHKKEKELKSLGLDPYGSGLCHGMVLGEDKMSVQRDSKPSAAWYSRLV